jgi:hypothetical protein
MSQVASTGVGKLEVFWRVAHSGMGQNNRHGIWHWKCWRGQNINWHLKYQLYDLKKKI